MGTYYEELEVSPTASPEVIRAAFRTLAQRYHPDRYSPEEREHFLQRMQRVNVAYTVLSNPAAKAKYDEKLRLLREHHEQAQRDDAGRRDSDANQQKDPTASPGGGWKRSQMAHGGAAELSSKDRAATSADDNRIAKVMGGQKLLIYAILLQIAALILGVVAMSEIADWIYLLAAVMSVIGIIRVGAGFGYSIVRVVVVVILMFVPLVNLITLFIVNGRASAELRAAGFTVGIMGARR